jgi:hypothetical protein
MESNATLSQTHPPTHAHNFSAVLGRLQCLIYFFSKGSDLEDDTGDDAKSVRTTEDNKKYVSLIEPLIIAIKKLLCNIMPLSKGNKKMFDSDTENKKKQLVP